MSDIDALLAARIASKSYRGEWPNEIEDRKAVEEVLKESLDALAYAHRLQAKTGLQEGAKKFTIQMLEAAIGLFLTGWPEAKLEEK